MGLTKLQRLRLNNFVSEHAVDFDKQLWELKGFTQLPFWIIFQKLLEFVFTDEVLFNRFKNKLIIFSKERGN